MKNNSVLKILFLSMILSSCGLIEQFKTADEPTDSENTEAVAETSTENVDATDDLFIQTMNETESSESGKDAPSNIASTDPDLLLLEDEFSPAGPSDTSIKESNINIAGAESAMLVEEALPEIKSEVAKAEYSDSGTIKTYKVQRGDTLMQISFKLYGDTSKWKDLKNMNSNKLTNNSSLKVNTEIKYRAPDSPFVWNPQGTPYLIKTGETLGTISNSVYSTPKKWKAIWENNKPLIKNPNVIYAGFTLYYKNGGMANYVQPKTAQPKKEILARELAREAAYREGIVEEVIVRDSMIEQAPIKTKTASIREVNEREEEEQIDEAIQTLSSTKRLDVKNAIENTINAPKEAEIDLINNISVPHAPEFSPDIDEEIQTL